MDPVIVSIENNSDRLVIVRHQGPEFTGTSHRRGRNVEIGLYEGGLMPSDWISPGKTLNTPLEIFPNPHDVLIPVSISIRPKLAKPGQPQGTPIEYMIYHTSGRKPALKLSATGILDDVEKHVIQEMPYVYTNPPLVKLVINKDYTVNFAPTK